MVDDGFLQRAIGKAQILYAVCIVELDRIADIFFDEFPGHAEKRRGQPDNEFWRHAFGEGVAVAETLPEDSADFDQLDFAGRYDMPP